MIGKGVTVWTATNNIEQEFKDKIRDILKCFGKAIYVEDEKFIDMSTSISGSGPAYIFLLMEAMIDAGVHMVRSACFHVHLVIHAIHYLMLQVFTNGTALVTFSS
jgi:pyrroline-5-carboxylate reductase